MDLQGKNAQGPTYSKVYAAPMTSSFAVAAPMPYQAQSPVHESPGFSLQGMGNPFVSGSASLMRNLHVVRCFFGSMRTRSRPCIITS